MRFSSAMPRLVRAPWRWKVPIRTEGIDSSSGRQVRAQPSLSCVQRLRQLQMLLDDRQIFLRKPFQRRIPPRLRLAPELGHVLLMALGVVTNIGAVEGRAGHAAKATILG